MNTTTRQVIPRSAGIIIIVVTMIGLAIVAFFSFSQTPASPKTANNDFKKSERLARFSADLTDKLCAAPVFQACVPRQVSLCRDKVASMIPACIDAALAFDSSLMNSLSRAEPTAWTTFGATVGSCVGTNYETDARREGTWQETKACQETVSGLQTEAKLQQRFGNYLQRDEMASAMVAADPSFRPRLFEIYKKVAEKNTAEGSVQYYQLLREAEQKYLPYADDEDVLKLILARKSQLAWMRDNNPRLCETLESGAQPTSSDAQAGLTNKQDDVWKGITPKAILSGSRNKNSADIRFASEEQITKFHSELEVHQKQLAVRKNANPCDDVLATLEFLESKPQSVSLPIFRQMLRE